ncbi:shikimate dehydrogenase [Armatimonas rosea]|uniref:Putative amino acid dehydrogenase n=1 Tax=Armatimonas rosea TaxID=685828 RepID=A0A7W9W6T6_ARMRO|nr:shikimate dehydrogenase [Armatimonas rosea]MBB6051784.1 putative amino acid dehydrogenase [Armatimonas rosea]
MERFAFIIHPIDVRKDLSRKFPVAQHLPEPLLAALLRQMSPQPVAHLTGIRSATGVEAEGWFIACPLSPHQLLNLPPEQVYAKLLLCCEHAERLGAKIIGLGALTSVAGDGGITLAQRTKLAVTTGNSYTVATAVEGAIKGAELMGTPFDSAHVAIVGASGSIGHTSALLLAPHAAKITLVGRDTERLKPVAREVTERGGKSVQVTSSVEEGLRDADVIVTVTSAADAIILPQHLKRGAVVCDVARPRDVSVRVAKERNDVLVIEGGCVQIPGSFTATKTDKKGVDRPGELFSFGFPPGTAYACMSETMMLALEGRYESFTLGKTVSVAQVEETWRLAKKHGFELAGFRSFEEAVTAETIAAVRLAAGRKLG